MDKPCFPERKGFPAHETPKQRNAPFVAGDSGLAGFRGHSRADGHRETIGGVTWSYDRVRRLARVLGAAPKDGVLSSKDRKELAACPGGKGGMYQVPSTVRRIWDYAFYDTKLTSIVVPDTVEELGVEVFRASANLVSVVLPSGLKALPEQCFSYCHSLRSVPLPAGLTDIPGWAFYHCEQLGEISIPSGVTNIG